ncbi:MAG: hypothetical protein GC150_11385 [Rhizobiales bacterium]|nr:hypothetical protein [Hyphomicrobiales bacterium]
MQVVSGEPLGSVGAWQGHGVTSSRAWRGRGWAILLAIASLGLGAASANAEGGPRIDSAIGDRPVVLVFPSDYCVMSRDHPSDARAIGAVDAALAGTNELLGMAAKCDERESWHSGRLPTLNAMVQYQTNLQMRGTDLPVDRAEFAKLVCEQISQNKIDVEGILKEAKERIESAVEGIEVNSSNFLGTLEVEPSACYAALVQKLKAETGEVKTQLAVYASTIIKKRILFTYLFREYQGADTVVQLSGELKDLVAQLYAANPE